MSLRSRVVPNRKSAVTLGALLPVLIVACDRGDWAAPTQSYRQCGTFSLQSTVSDFPVRPVPSLKFNVQFDFNPQMCGLQCVCEDIAFIQILRLTDQSKPAKWENFQIHPEQEWRMMRDEDNPLIHGWSLDRADDRTYPFYARNDDGTWDTISNLRDPWTGWIGYTSLGSNSSSAILLDSITYEPKNTFRVDAVQVPICVGENARSSCPNRVLGYHGFAYNVTPDPVRGQQLSTPTEVHFPALRSVVCEAVRNWNTQEGKHDLFVEQDIPCDVR